MKIKIKNYHSHRTIIKGFSASYSKHLMCFIIKFLKLLIQYSSNCIDLSNNAHNYEYNFSVSV